MRSDITTPMEASAASLRTVAIAIGTGPIARIAANRNAVSIRPIARPISLRRCPLSGVTSYNILMSKLDNLNASQRKILEKYRGVIDRNSPQKSNEKESGEKESTPRDKKSLEESLVERALELRKTTPERRMLLSPEEALDAAISNNQRAHGILLDKKKLLRAIRSEITKERESKLF